MFTYRTSLRFLFITLLTTISYAKETPHLITPNQVTTPLVANLPYELQHGVKVFHLTAEAVTKIIFDEKNNQLNKFVKKHNRYTGKEMQLPFTSQILRGWGYNGEIPGPTIIVNQNDKVKIIVANKLPEPTTIHWHGLIVPNNQDGTGGTASPVINSGKTGVYEFVVKNPPGTYAYHSGFNDTKQVGLGLNGFFIVLPKDGKNNVDSDFAIMLRGWSVARDGKINFLSMANNWFTFNGVVAPNFPVLQVPYNAHVRIRFANIGGIDAHPIHLHGYTFMITGTEGGPIPKSAQWPAATVLVASGTTRDIEFVANNPGLWRLHCHILHHIVNDHPVFEKMKNISILPEGGMYAYLEVTKRPSR